MEGPNKLSLPEQLSRTFWVLHRLAAVNIICFLVFLPVFSWFYLVLNLHLHAGASVGMGSILPGLGYFAGLLLRLPPVIFYTLFAASAVLFGPFLLGLHYVTSAIFAGRHVWFSDLFTQARQNARQGILLGFFCILGTHLLLWNIFAGLTSPISWLALGLAASRWVSIGLLALLLLTLPYFCQIAVAIDLPFWAVLKNARILARVYLGRSLLLLFGVTVLLWIALSLFPAFGLLGLPLLLIGLVALAQAAVCFPAVERHVIEPARR